MSSRTRTSVHVSPALWTFAPEAAPGVYGNAAAVVAELTISLVLMTTVLLASDRERIARYTPYFAGALVAIYIAFETPLSGMSMNPA